MTTQEIEELKLALEKSPENITLRLILGKKLMQFGQYEAAEKEFQTVLMSDKSNILAQEGLCESYFQRERYSGVIVIAEDLIASGLASEKIMVLCAKSFLREKSLDDAQKVYELILDANPEFEDNELDQALRLPFEFDGDEDDGYPFEFGAPDDKDFFMEKPETNFSDVGGMDDLKEQIDLKFIKPLENAHLYAAYGKKVGGGLLLYGPPGCGKTFLARATAGEIKANFINVGINDILDMWNGRSEKNMAYIFDVARRNAPCVLFFDEVDALGANRTDIRNASGRYIINQFLSELDGVNQSNEGVLIMGATNAPWHLDPAFRRPGRFDKIVFVAPPDDRSKEHILTILLKNKPVDRVDVKKVLVNTAEFSGADLAAMVDVAVERKLKEALKTGVPAPLTTNDLIAAKNQIQASTKEWFKTAKNYALFANDSGIYDPILKYLKI
ncbi:MAG: AAA family ATPase [Lewinellaceae bacterium]|nr:AAA family ATPase [Lewinellaceae bacterium]